MVSKEYRTWKLMTDDTVVAFLFAEDGHRQEYATNAWECQDKGSGKSVELL